MGGLFDDVFDDENWEIKDDKDASKEDNFESDIWNTGAKADQWTTDEPWTSEETIEEIESKESLDLSDFF